jgi:uncharacterized RDD family membrane protein YckC
MTSPAPGWYPDPHVPQQMRWWDGTAWTDDTYERTIPLEQGVGTAAGSARRSATTSTGGPGVPRSPARGGLPSTVLTAATTTEDGVPLAGWGWRALARVIDSVLVSGLALLVAFPATATVMDVVGAAFTDSLDAAQGGAQQSAAVWTDPRLITAIGVLSLVQLVLSLAYELAFLLWRQATPGKLLVGLRVRPWTPGTRLTATAIARRWLASDGAQSVPNIGTLYYVLDVCWPLRDQRRQALHDKFAGTCVVRPSR